MLCCGHAKEPFSCDVVLLDGHHLNFSKNQKIKVTTKAHILFDAVCLHLNLVEKDYFGLKFYDNQLQRHWLDPTKALCDDNSFSNVANNPPCVLHFGVKFYAADPCALKEEVTRYQFFLQLKKDILSSKLTCSWKKAAEVSALALQSEIGDYHTSEHKRGYVSEFRFLQNQDEKFESEVARLHATFKGLVPSSAEMQFLRKCRQFDLYGVEVHQVKGDAGMQYTIGISPRGIETFKNKYRITIYYWPRIELVDYKDQYLKLRVKNKQGRETTRNFELRSPELCKHVWKSIVEHHVFYRLPQNIPSTTWNKKYRYSGRTEAEMLQSEVEREEPEVQRGSSKRYPPRVRDNNEEHEKENDENKQMTNHESMVEETWSKVLDKKGMFSVADIDQNTSVKYMTPKNERRERNRQLQSLSDTENRNRKHRSHRGRSSGEESDSPSKRRIRSRARHNRSNHGSDVSENSHVRRRRRKCHTDTEMVNGRVDVERVRRKSNNSSTSQSRKSKRLSKQDEEACQKLWQHIKRDMVDPSDKSPEQLRDISYTEVKTEGNPTPVRVRHNRHRNSSGKRTSGVSTNSYAQALEEGMVSPLSITTTVLQEKQRAMYGNGHRYKSPPTKSPGKDWDTRTSLSVDDFHSVSTTGNPHRSRHRRNRTTERPRESDLKLVYSQI